MTTNLGRPRRHSSLDGRGVLGRAAQEIEGLRSQLALVKADLEACDADRDVEIAKTKRLEAEIELLRVVTRAARALMRTDTRRIDGLSEEAYRAWCQMRDGLTALREAATESESVERKEKT